VTYAIKCKTCVSQTKSDKLKDAGLRVCDRRGIVNFVFVLIRFKFNIYRVE
jgi:hypothetical protein